MKTFGISLCVGALFVLIATFIFYDTSVSTGFGGRVHNIGLMNEKQNIIIGCSGMLVAGALLLALSGRGQGQPTVPGAGYRKCPNCAELVKGEAKVCRYCQRDLPLVAEFDARAKSDHEQRAEDKAR